MKKFTQLLVDRLNVFLGNTLVKPSSDEELEQAEILNSIHLALHKKAAVHVIYSKQKSITGEIVKWDDRHKQLIVKNFRKNITAIIRFRTIQKISLVPEGIRVTQKAR